MNTPSWSVLCALGLTVLSAPISAGAPASPPEGPPMLPGSAEAYGRYVQVTSAAVPRTFAPSSKLTFDPSLTRLIAAASVKSTSRYAEPAGWPDVFSPGNGPGGSTAPVGGGGSSAGQSPSVPGVPSVPVPPAVEPGGGFGAGGGGWVPSPVIPPPSTSSGSSGGAVPPPSVVPEFPTSVVPLPIPDTPVVISIPSAAGPVDGRVPDGGATFLMLGASSLLLAALRKRLPPS